MSEMFSATIKATRKLFYSEDTSFGIYGIEVLDSDRMDLVELNPYGNITMKGSMPELDYNTTYIAELTPKKDPKYGMGYEVSTIYAKPLSTRREIDAFLQSVLTPFQSTSIIEAYPKENVIELIKSDKFDYSKVKGIGEATFQKIKEKIIDNEKYQKAIVILTGEYGIPFNAVKKLSDSYGSPDLLVQKIKKNPYILTEVDGYGFKKADELALKMGIDAKSSYRINACIIYILDEQAGNGHCWVKKNQLINEAIKVLNVKISDIEEVLIEDNGKYALKDNIIYNKKYFEYEDGISSNIFRLLESKTEYQVKDIDDKIEKVEKEQGFQFTDEQRNAISLAVENNIICVNGKAGTGKTSVIKGIVEVLKSVDGLGYATCALSGKASQRIQESTGLNSFTIHRLLGFNPRAGFTYDEHEQLPHDIIILDEASMVNSQLFFYLIRAIKNGAKLIITGDTAQLEPIGVGNVLVDLLASGVVPKVELTIVHRQAQKSGILSCANMVREGKKFLSNSDFGQKRLGELKDLYMYSYEDKEKVFNSVLAIARKYNGDIFDFQIIAPMKSRGELSTKNLNQELQKIFNQDPKDVDSEKKLEKKNLTFLEGDKVIINGNNYDKNLFNGTMGVISDISHNNVGEKGEKNTVVTINFEGIGNVEITKEEMNNMDLAYAITGHKSQGSQWKYVVCAIDYASYVLLNRQLTYTIMTRASEALFMAVELKALQHSINTNKSTDRKTFLPSLLKSTSAK